jgi:hypothetical protein
MAEKKSVLKIAFKNTTENIEHIPCDKKLQVNTI